MTRLFMFCYRLPAVPRHYQHQQIQASFIIRWVY